MGFLFKFSSSISKFFDFPLVFQTGHVTPHFHALKAFPGLSDVLELLTAQCTAV